MGDFYRVVFSGELAEGQKKDQVKAKLTKLLKEDPGVIEGLFSGKKHTIKQRSDLATCEKIVTAFSSAGAICIIEKISRQTDIIDESSSLEAKQEDSEKRASAAGSSHYEHLKGSIDLKLQNISGFLKELTGNAKGRGMSLYSEVNSSVRSDMETGGAQLLVKNKYLQILSAAFICLTLLVFIVLSYESKVMPINEKNFELLAQHIEFIEKAFTIEELEAMTKNPSEFLDYLLVDPIMKMGYEFDSTVEEIADMYLDGDLSEAERQGARKFLLVAAKERNKLLQHGFVSERLAMKLAKISSKLDESIN